MGKWDGGGNIFKFSNKVFMSFSAECPPPQVKLSCLQATSESCSRERVTYFSIYQKVKDDVFRQFAEMMECLRVDSAHEAQLLIRNIPSYI